MKKGKFMWIHCSIKAYVSGISVCNTVSWNLNVVVFIYLPFTALYIPGSHVLKHEHGTLLMFQLCYCLTLQTFLAQINYRIMRYQDKNIGTSGYSSLHHYCHLNTLQDHYPISSHSLCCQDSLIFHTSYRSFIRVRTSSFFFHFINRRCVVF